jgi:hypothetical protein
VRASRAAAGRTSERARKSATKEVSSMRLWGVRALVGPNWPGKRPPGQSTRGAVSLPQIWPLAKSIRRSGFNFSCLSTPAPPPPVGCFPVGRICDETVRAAQN